MARPEAKVKRIDECILDIGDAQAKVVVETVKISEKQAE